MTTPCTCEAYPFPHRPGGGDCEEDKVCEHGTRTPDHPDYDCYLDHCYECAYWDAVDYYMERER